MERIEKHHLEEIFRRLNESWDFRKEVASFNKLFQSPLWIMVPVIHGNVTKLTKSELVRNIKEQSGGHAVSPGVISIIYKTAKSSEKTKSLGTFRYEKDLNGICYPLKASGRTFGLAILCGIKKKIQPDFKAIFQAFTDTIISEMQKDMELEELNETIRPRAIALSTVHTVHRLMSSTLNMSELVPRIARLTLQVMRANRCSIKLVDTKRQVLLPVATVDLRKEKTKLKKVQIGKYAPGRAVKQGKPIRGKNYLATPLIENEVLGVITLYDKIDGSEFSSYDQEIMKTLAEQAVIAIKNAQLYEEQESLTMGSIKCIGMLLAARPHGAHMAEASFHRLIQIIGRKFNMNETEIKMMQYAATLHDTGQISIPEKVLMKRGGLTGTEFDIVKSHTVEGAKILSKIRPLKPIVPIILYHHENYDGTGYPKGLVGEEIPLQARILAVVSAFEAMITEKPYRKAMPIDAAVKEVRKNAGTQFDPKVVDAFCDAVSRKNVLKLLGKELVVNAEKY